MIPQQISPIKKKGHNNAYIGMMHGQRVFVKHYKDSARFRNAIKFNYIFKSNGFQCPRLLMNQAKGLWAVFEYIQGTACCGHNLAEVIQCIHVIAHIQNRLTPIICPLSQHAKKKKEIITQVEREFFFHFPLGIDKQHQISKLLRTYFLLGVFKDAKPDNWLFTPSKDLFLVDFDYVKIAHTLSDVAQLFTYSLLENPALDVVQLGNIYLEEIALSIPPEAHQTLLLFFMLYSNIKKKPFLRDKKTLNSLLKQNSTLLQKLVNHL